MANVQIPNLPASTSLSGNEQVEIVQAGVSARATVQQIANLAPTPVIQNVGYFGSFFDSTTQTAVSSTTEYIASLNSSFGASGLSVVDNTKMTFAYAGTYTITFCAQMVNASVSAQTASFWLKKNGSAVSDTNYKISVPASSGSLATASVTLTVNVGDYLQLAWQASSSDLKMTAANSQTTPTRPATPSLVVGICQVADVNEFYNNITLPEGVVLGRGNGEGTGPIQQLPLFIDPTTGNVGIGTDALTSLFNVDGQFGIALGTVNAPAIHPFGGVDTGMWFPDAGTVAFSSNGTERLRVGSTVTAETAAFGTDSQQVATTAFVQDAFDGNLTPSGKSLVALNGTTDQVPYFSGPATAALASFTASARSTAALNGTTDQLSYFSGAATAALTSLTAGGRALIGLAGAANRFPYFTGVSTAAAGVLTNGGLALLGVAGAANTVPYYTGTGTASSTSFTSSGRAIVALSGAANQMPYYTGSGTAAVTGLTAAGRALIDDATADDQLTTLGGTTVGKAVFKAVDAAAARAAIGLGAITPEIAETVSESFARIIHANSYANIGLAFADLGDNECLELSGGETYPYTGGTITSFPANFCVRSDNGVKATIDFSGNAAWQPGGLLQITSALEAATEEALTSTMTAVTQTTQITSGSAVGQVCTVGTAGPHGYTTGDWVFIRYGDSAVAGQIAYCTEHDSDEGTALDKPVQVTVISPTSFSYTAYSGTPAATLTIFPYTWKNNQVVQVSSTADYAAGDLVFLQSTEQYQSFTGTQSCDYGEMNTIAEIIDSTNMMLSEPIAYSYKTSYTAKITKVTKKTCSWENIKFIGKGPNPGRSAYGQSDMGMLMYLLYRPQMINCEFEACDYIAHWNRSNYYPYFKNCIATLTESAAGGKDTGIIEIQYGWAYGNATRGMLYEDCQAFNGRHGFDEFASGSYPGILYDWTLVRPKAFNQWSNNIDTHGMNFNGRIIDPEIRGGDGIGCRNGSLVCTGIRSYNTKRSFRAIGRVVDLTVSVEVDEGGTGDRIYIAPSTDIATPTPDSTNINILGLSSKSGGQMGVRLFSPNGHKFISPYFGPIVCVGLMYYPLYLTTSGTGEIVAPISESVTGIDCGSYVVYHDNVSYANFKRVFGRRTGSFTLVGSNTSGATANRYNGVSGLSTSGGTVTKFSLNASSTGNFTDSLDYESKTIASGAVTKNFRNVPLLIVYTEGGAASDDLDTVNGLLHGDQLFIRTNSSTGDVNLTNAGNLRQPITRLLTDSGQIQSYVNNGSQNVTSSYGNILTGSKTYDCPSLAAGASTTTTITVTGAALGDFVLSVSFGVDTQGLDIEWEVSTTDTVFLRIHNHTGGTIDLASTTVSTIVMKNG